MKLLQMADPVRYARMTSAELRETFLLEGMFNPGRIDLAYVDLDRAVIGFAAPTTGAALEHTSHPRQASARRPVNTTCGIKAPDKFLKRGQHRTGALDGSQGEAKRSRGEEKPG